MIYSQKFSSQTSKITLKKKCLSLIVLLCKNFCYLRSDLSKYFDDANEVLGEIDKVKKIRKNNSKNKESKLLNSIYRTSESREKKIKKIKRNYKDLPLEDYQVMLVSSKLIPA
jgi:hypothetical protein